METVRTQYQGDYRTLATHVQSNNQLITDAPRDNNGKGDAFSPTDLIVTGLSSCMLTVMAISANSHGIDLGYPQVKTTKIMTANPRRISRIEIEFEMGTASLSDKEKTLLEKAAASCPAAKSLHPDIEVVTKFSYITPS